MKKKYTIKITQLTDMDYEVNDLVQRETTGDIFYAKEEFMADLEGTDIVPIEIHVCEDGDVIGDPTANIIDSVVRNIIRNGDEIIVEKNWLDNPLLTKDGKIICKTLLNDAWDSFYTYYYHLTGKKVTDDEYGPHDFIKWMMDNCDPPKTKEKIKLSY